MLRILAPALLCASLPVAAAAQSPVQAPLSAPALDAAAQGVADFLRGERKAEAIFAPEFLAAVPEAQLAALGQQLAAQLGPLRAVQSITPAGADKAVLALRFEKGIISGPMTLAASGKVNGLLLNKVDAVDDSLAKIEAELKALPGQVAVWYGPLDGDAPILAIEPDRALAVGSTFKLTVLSALAHEIAAGRHRWDEVVRLDALRSLPSGMTQDWPANAPMTLQTLATLMISISDNTATDRLIRLLGRGALAKELAAAGHSAPARTLPFLTTREVFALKGDPAQGRAYAAADEAGQARLLAALDARLAADPGAGPLPTFTAPMMIDTLEWFYSPRDVVRQLARIAALDDPTARAILAASPSVPKADRSAFTYIGYKGGSEPGVLNLTWLLQPADGQAMRVLTLTWNDPAAALDQSGLELLAMRLLKLKP